MTTAALHRPIIAYNWPNSPVKLISNLQNIVKMSTGNQWLTASTALITTLTTSVAALVAGQILAKQRAAGAATARDVLARAAKSDAEDLGDAVQAVADANPTQSLAIIESCGFKAKTVTLPKKAPTKASLGPVAGAAILNVLAIAGAITYYWQMSTDKATWTDILPSGGSKTTVTGLTSGTTYYFRFRVLLKGGYTDWSTPFSYHVP
jgi:hypothetical protein